MKRENWGHPTSTRNPDTPKLVVSRYLVNKNLVWKLISTKLDGVQRESNTLMFGATLNKIYTTMLVVN